MCLKAKDMKYTIGSEDDDYKTKLFLNITLTESADFGAYYCISKNEKGLTKGAVELYGKQTRSIQRMNPPPNYLRVQECFMIIFKLSIQ